MDEYLTVAQLRTMLAAFPDDAYVSLVSQFGDTGMLTVDSVVDVMDGSGGAMSHVYLYGETTVPILEAQNG